MDNFHCSFDPRFVRRGPHTKEADSSSALPNRQPVVLTTLGFLGETERALNVQPTHCLRWLLLLGLVSHRSCLLILLGLGL
jgi:hypothetical protein